MRTKNNFFILLMLLMLSTKQSHAAAMARPALAGLSRQAMMARMASHQRPQTLLVAGRFQDNRGLAAGASPQMPEQERQEIEERPVTLLAEEEGQGREQQGLQMLTAGSREFKEQGAGFRKKDGIYDYVPEDEEALLEIGMQHRDRLGVGSREDLARVFEQSSIVPGLMKNKVYFCDGVPVGFVSYGLVPQRYRRFIPKCPIGPNATIAFLAVYDQHQKKGTGSKLLQVALDDLQAQSVNNIKLVTTGNEVPAELRRLYSKFGFEIDKHGLKYADTFWNKRSGPYSRFTPSPAKVILLKNGCKLAARIAVVVAIFESGEKDRSEQGEQADS